MGLWHLFNYLKTYFLCAVWSELCSWQVRWTAYLVDLSLHSWLPSTGPCLREKSPSSIYSFMIQTKTQSLWNSLGQHCNIRTMHQGKKSFKIWANFHLKYMPWLFFLFSPLRNRRALMCHGNSSNENNRHVLSADYVAGLVLSAVCSWSILLNFFSSGIFFVVVFSNINRYVLKHTDQTVWCIRSQG